MSYRISETQFVSVVNFHGYLAGRNPTAEKWALPGVDDEERSFRRSVLPERESTAVPLFDFTDPSIWTVAYVRDLVQAMLGKTVRVGELTEKQRQDAEKVKIAELFAGARVSTHPGTQELLAMTDSIRKAIGEGSPTGILQDLVALTEDDETLLLAAGALRLSGKLLYEFEKWLKQWEESPRKETDSVWGDLVDIVVPCRVEDDAKIAASAVMDTNVIRRSLSKIDLLSNVSEYLMAGCDPSTILEELQHLASKPYIYQMIRVCRHKWDRDRWSEILNDSRQSIPRLNLYVEQVESGDSKLSSEELEELFSGKLSVLDARKRIAKRSPGASADVPATSDHSLKSAKAWIEAKSKDGKLLTNVEGTQQNIVVTNFAALRRSRNATPLSLICAAITQVTLGMDNQNSLLETKTKPDADVKPDVDAN